MKRTLPPTIRDLLKAQRLAAGEAESLVPGTDIVLPTRDTRGVTVVIIAYHSGRILFDSIERVLAETAVKQLILIDNGSSERTIELLREIDDAYERVLLVQGHGNIGFARAANMGAQLATQPWVVFLNPDAILCDGAVEALVDTALKTPRPCLVGARVLNPDGTEQRGSRRGEVTPVTTLVSLMRLSKYLPFLCAYEIHREHEPLPESPAPVAAVSGACFCISRADFLSVGGFDTRFFLHVEDVDLCWRIRKKGGAVLFHPTAEVIHEGHTSRVDPVFVEMNKGLGLVYYFRKRADSLWRKAYVLALAPLIVGISVLRAVLRRRLRDADDFS
ncbi:glycosyltransferase family 2 protein [Asticcacaulis excentricus]|uniref:Glycosyl transferase family 2 n=1 Tax=Asticcacaulis excentricus (strain ATCC 15261 / DSM 4724 / KCTC 12464 / NCIMB 9791 / VKM B-1370 / CB 48) TaxID=573065 RepID=E8RRH8_ASTEC|nr:glycosyltransferase family 2 protein [Asticcacaulis excentricus]ADU13423.1 glycosyl transferase family 2 [Asticcacaulis excentricus CB 48]